jgi:hypothetical protein
MDIETASREELKEYASYLMTELGKELTPEEVGYSGMSWSDYKALRSYQIERLVAVNNRLLRTA